MVTPIVAVYSYKDHTISAPSTIGMLAIARTHHTAIGSKELA